MNQRTFPEGLPLTLNIKEVAAALGVSRATAYRIVNAGLIEKVRIGQRSARYRRDDVERLLGLGPAEWDRRRRR